MVAASGEVEMLDGSKREGDIAAATPMPAPCKKEMVGCVYVYVCVCLCKCACLCVSVCVCAFSHILRHGKAQATPQEVARMPGNPKQSNERSRCIREKIYKEY
jgi:hypothetical protein